MIAAWNDAIIEAAVALDHYIARGGTPRTYTKCTERRGIIVHEAATPLRDTVTGIACKRWKVVVGITWIESQTLPYTPDDLAELFHLALYQSAVDARVIDSVTRLPVLVYWSLVGIRL